MSGVRVAYDPYDEEAMTEPQRLYALLREHEPVYRLEQYDAWALARFADVWQVCSDTASFSVARGQTPNQVLLGEPAANLTFPELDPPEHRLRRRVLAPAYTREAAQDDVAMIRAITREVLAPLLEAGSFDAFEDYASVVSARVAAAKAGIPDADADRLRRLLHRSMDREPGQRGHSDTNNAARGEAFGLLAAHVNACRSDPSLASGTLALLLDATIDGEPLSDLHLTAELLTLLVTGSETVEYGTAAAVYHLWRHPEQQQALLDDPALAPFAFAEAVRYDHPTDMLCRVVRRDVEVGGTLLREGQGVLLLWASANRDEAEFDRADVFDIHRRPSRSLLFGHGQHKCIGEHIAGRMGTVLLEELFGAIRSIEVDPAGVRRHRAEFLTGYDAMPVTVTRR
jgi:cytochrome P450